MTRFVAGAVIHLAEAGIAVSGKHELLAPTLLRSQTLSALHEAVHRGEVPAGAAREAAGREASTVELHRCANLWAKFGPCWRVQKALDDQGVDYEIVAGPWRPRNRSAVIEGTGQPLYPAIRFENGSWYREESKEMARTIREGRLAEKQQRP